MDGITGIREVASTRAVLIPLPGIGGHAGDFAAWGEVLAERGIALAGADQPGFGARRDEPLSFPEDWVAALDEAIGAARCRWPGRPIITTGESLGSLVVLDHAARGAVRADGHVLASPAVRTPGKISLLGSVRILLLAAFGSRRPYDFTGKIDALTADGSQLEELQADPKRRRRLPPRWLVQARRLQGKALACAAKITAPTLILWGEEDQVGSFAAARGLLGAIDPPLRRLEVIRGERHMLTRGVRRRETAALIARWVEETVLPADDRTAEGPSRAGAAPAGDRGAGETTGSR